MVALLSLGHAEAQLSGTAQFTATVVGQLVLDIGPRGKGLGDASITRWRLTDRQGHTLGFGHQFCRWTTSTARACYGTYVLPDGQIQFQGVVGNGGPLAVTGGTGLYVGAKGQLKRSGKTVRVTL